MEELAEIKEAFETDGSYDLSEKTILDVGTDAVKPIYIALKYSPEKIVGINEWSRPFVSNNEMKSKILSPTKIRLYNCSLFNNVTLGKIFDKEEIKEFNYVLVSKTLHHLRTGKCIAHKRDKKHKCKEIEVQRETEKECIYQFKTIEIFDLLLDLGKRVIVFEYFDPNASDNDKVRGRGAYFTRNELIEMFESLAEGYRVQFIRPEKFLLTEKTLKRVKVMLKKIDEICFYVEKSN